MFTAVSRGFQNWARHVADLPVWYIATRAEYNKLKQATHPKLALDEFWLACGRTPTKPETCFRRTTTAWKRPTTPFRTGRRWKTDRGMVHVVFGIPQRSGATPGTSIGLRRGRHHQRPDASISGAKPPRTTTTTSCCNEASNSARLGTVRGAWRNGRVRAN